MLANRRIVRYSADRKGPKTERDVRYDASLPICGADCLDVCACLRIMHRKYTFASTTFPSKDPPLPPSLSVSDVC